MLFNRSKAKDYQDRPTGGFSGLLRSDSFFVRLLIFAAMSAVFFFFLKITETKIPRGLAPDTTDDSGKAPATATHRTK